MKFKICAENIIQDNNDILAINNDIFSILQKIKNFKKISSVRKFFIGQQNFYHFKDERISVIIIFLQKFSCF